MKFNNIISTYLVGIIILASIYSHAYSMDQRKGSPKTMPVPPLQPLKKRHPSIERIKQDSIKPSESMTKIKEFLNQKRS